MGGIEKIQVPKSWLSNAYTNRFWMILDPLWGRLEIIFNAFGGFLGCLLGLFWDLFQI